MTRLSVNINKIATIRTARGGNTPDIINAARKCQLYGADGITIHPRPDQRHAKFSDIPSINNLVKKYNHIEFNIEGYPSKQFIKEVIKNRPQQVTLVPDPPDALTSSFGWNCEENKNFLKEVR